MIKFFSAEEASISNIAERIVIVFVQRSGQTKGSEVDSPQAEAAGSNYVIGVGTFKWIAKFEAPYDLSRDQALLGIGDCIIKLAGFIRYVPIELPCSFARQADWQHKQFDLTGG